MCWTCIYLTSYTWNKMWETQTLESTLETKQRSGCWILAGLCWIKCAHLTSKFSQQKQYNGKDKDPKSSFLFTVNQDCFIAGFIFWAGSKWRNVSHVASAPPLWPEPWGGKPTISTSWRVSLLCGALRVWLDADTRCQYSGVGLSILS